MAGLYNYEYYHNNCGPIAYEDPKHWVEFFGAIADHIIADLGPKTVLDAGCAMGYLVAALRDRGVEAYGIDISDYAISKVREDVRPYCVVGSLTEPLPEVLPQRYDLVVTIEVLEHLYEEEGKQVIRNLCALSDHVLFSSTPDDFKERTHFNVQQREYWARLFASEGFLDDLNYRPTYLTAYASYFKKSANWLRQLEDYERNIRMSETDHAQHIQEWQRIVEDKERHIQDLTSIQSQKEEQWRLQIGEYESAIRQGREELEQARKDAAQEQNQIQENAAQELEREREQSAKALEQVQKELVQERESASENLIQIQEEARRELEQLQETSSQELNSLNAKYSAVFSMMMKARKECQQIREAMDYRQQTATEERCRLDVELAHYKEHYLAAINQREELKRELAQVQYAYNVISNAFFWKITKPFRVVLDGIKGLLKSNRYTYLCCKGLKCWKENGTKYTWRRVQDKLHHRQDFTKAVRPLFTEEELEEQRKDTFPRKVKFSIVVPLYNTPEEFLHEMIQSVLDQTYGNWELCMADGSDSKHRSIEKICRQYIRKDSRIKYRKLKENLGISENTNACIDMASGDYIALFDHDDLLHPAALHEVMKAICDQNADFIYTDEAIFHFRPEDSFDFHFKSDYGPDTLHSVNYICHLSVFKAEYLNMVGKLNPKCDGSQDFDLILRLTEIAKKIVHIPMILYFWRSHPASTADSVKTKPYVVEAGHLALKGYLRRAGLEGEILDTAIPTMYRIRYKVQNNPLISIIIPNQDHLEDLRTCLESIYTLSTYHNFEIVIVENNSKTQEIFSYYDEIKTKWENIEIINWEGPFNYSAINNYGVQFARGEHILLLNNDTKVITPEWLEEMLMFSQRADVGGVGAKLYYPDDKIQHAGVIIGIGSTAGHQHKGANRGDYGYLGRLIYAQNLSAVTGACMMVRRSVWDEVGGLDTKFAVAFNDVDFCLRIRKAGYLIVWTPYAELYHYESKSRGYEDTPEKQKRFAKEIQRFQTRWRKELGNGDPYYNPNLTLDREDFSLS